MRFLFLIILMLPFSSYGGTTTREYAVANLTKYSASVTWVSTSVVGWHYDRPSACQSLAQAMAASAQWHPSWTTTGNTNFACYMRRGSDGHTMNASISSSASNCPTGFTRDTTKAASHAQACYKDTYVPDCSDTDGEEIEVMQVCANYLCSAPPVLNTATGKYECPQMTRTVVRPPTTINVAGCKATLIEIGAITEQVSGSAPGSPPAQSGSYLCETKYVTTAEPSDGTESVPQSPEGTSQATEKPNTSTPDGAGNAPGSGSGDGQGGSGSSSGEAACTPEKEKLGLCKMATGSTDNGGTPGAGQTTNCTPEMEAAGQCQGTASYGAPNSCAAPPVCQGDPILCGLGKQHWQAVCSLVEVTATDRSTFEGVITSEQQAVKNGVAAYNEKAQGFFQAFQTKVDQTVATQSWCPSDVVVSILGGHQLTFPFGRPEVCDIFKLIRLFVLLGAYIQAMRIVLGGIK